MTFLPITDGRHWSREARAESLLPKKNLIKSIAEEHPCDTRHRLARNHATYSLLVDVEQGQATFLTAKRSDLLTRFRNRPSSEGRWSSGRP